jgi:hypothetical protein
VRCDWMAVLRERRETWGGEGWRVHGGREDGRVEMGRDVRLGGETHEYEPEWQEAGMLREVGHDCG